jgi:hypothetical protein
MRNALAVALKIVFRDVVLISAVEILDMQVDISLPARTL